MTRNPRHPLGRCTLARKGRADTRTRSDTARRQHMARDNTIARHTSHARGLRGAEKALYPPGVPTEQRYSCSAERRSTPCQCNAARDVEAALLLQGVLAQLRGVAVSRGRRGGATATECRSGATECVSGFSAPARGPRRRCAPRRRLRSRRYELTVRRA